MILYLIRHGHAEDRAVWDRPDLERPLIHKGIKRAVKAFSKFFSLYSPPSIIISSDAVRSIETAEILHDICGVEMRIRAVINPGADTSDYEAVIEEFKKLPVIAIVGHEPDMSEFISDYLTDGELFSEFKKGSICHIENKCLINYIQQKVLI